MQQWTHERASVLPLRTLGVLIIISLNTPKYRPSAAFSGSFTSKCKPRKTFTSPCLQNLCFKFRFVRGGGGLGAPMAYRVHEINYIQQNTSSKANLTSAIQKFHHIFWNPPTVPILSHSNTVHPPPPQTVLLNIYFHIIIPSTPRSSKWFLSLGISHQTRYAPLLVPIRATRPANLILLSLITWMVRSKR